MALILAVANQKGGCGKNTVSMNLAGGFAKAGFKTLLVDADPQQSAMKWRNNQEESKLPFEVISLPSVSIHKDLPKVVANSCYEVVLIDCPPGGASKGDLGYGNDGICQNWFRRTDVMIIGKGSQEISDQ
jgi:chromosome partitioning protein